MCPKFGVQHDTQAKNTAIINTQNTVDGKRGYFIGDIISPRGVNETNKTQANPKFVHASPFVMKVFFFFFFLNISLTRGVAALLQPQESFQTFDQVSELE